MTSDCTCPNCSSILSLANSGPIGFNDILICSQCVTVLLFNHDLQPRVASSDDFREMSEDLRNTVGRVHRRALHTRQLEIRVERHSRN